MWPTNFVFHWCPPALPYTMSYRTFNNFLFLSSFCVGLLFWRNVYLHHIFLFSYGQKSQPRDKLGDLQTLMTDPFRSVIDQECVVFLLLPLLQNCTFKTHIPRNFAPFVILLFGFDQRCAERDTDKPAFPHGIYRHVRIHTGKNREHCRNVSNFYGRNISSICLVVCDGISEWLRLRSNWYWENQLI